MRLGKDEHHEGISRKRTLLVKDTATQILLQAQLPFLIRVEGEVMPLIHLVEVDSEFFCGELRALRSQPLLSSTPPRSRKRVVIRVLAMCVFLLSAAVRLGQKIIPACCPCVSLVALVSLVSLV